MSFSYNVAERTSPLATPTSAGYLHYSPSLQGQTAVYQSHFPCLFKVFGFLSLLRKQEPPCLDLPAF